MNSIARIVVVVEGGVVQTVLVAQGKIEFTVLDWDNAKAGDTIELPDWARAALDAGALAEIDAHNQKVAA